ncbi:hypothetical protein [Limnoglobus roseus]|uniref:hypothetical protein n=1 Tax=Limnoglobus roseus TaxID=2598579 RepID=UPI0011EB181F|nr:hypothetical protein [Limnoglobus roseus]
MKIVTRQLTEDVSFGFEICASPTGDSNEQNLLPPLAYGYPHLESHFASKSFEQAGHGLDSIASIPSGGHDEPVR